MKRGSHFVTFELSQTRLLIKPGKVYFHCSFSEVFSSFRWRRLHCFNGGNTFSIGWWSNVFHGSALVQKKVGILENFENTKGKTHQKQEAPQKWYSVRFFFCFLVIYAILGSIKKESTWNITAWVGIGKAALRGILLSANKPYNEFSDSNAILPDGKMHGPSGWRSNGVICGGDVSGCGSSRVGWWQDGDYWEAMERFE